MLFQERFKPGIRDGSITCTFRAWSSPRATVGKRYRLGPEDAVQVTAVDEQALGSISAAQARRCGFADAGELRGLLAKGARRRLTARTKVYRVRFLHVRSQDPRLERRADTSAAALDEVAARLDRMDRLSRRGPWTRRVLRLIQRRPETSAAVLAPELDRERLAFKADVRKLKGLGLTVSHGVGYSLSARGRALLAREGRRRG